MIPAKNNEWYVDATLIAGDRLIRAGTLIQCARRWANLPPEEQPKATIRLAQPLDGRTLLEGEQIAALASHPGYRFA